MELNWAGSWKMHVTTLLYPALGGSASFVASDWAGKLEPDIAGVSVKGGKNGCSQVTSQPSLTDLCSAHFSSVSAASLCTLSGGSTEAGLLARPVPWLWSLLWSHHPRTSTLSPSSTETCQTPGKRMYSNVPETPACELINTLQRCQLPGRSLESLTAACQCAGLWICTEKARFIQPECDPDSVPCVPCCPKPVWESQVAVLLCIKCTVNTVSLCFVQMMLFQLTDHKERSKYFYMSLKNVTKVLNLKFRRYYGSDKAISSCL